MNKTDINRKEAMIREAAIDSLMYPCIPRRRYDLETAPPPPKGWRLKAKEGTKAATKNGGWTVDMSNVGRGAEKRSDYYVDNTMNPLDEVVVTAKYPYENQLAKYILAKNDATGVYRDDIGRIRLGTPRNIDAIKNHKKGVAEPYVIIDKKNNKMYYMKRDKVIETHEITRGENVGDGYRPFTKETPYYSDLPRQTGAGVFTVRPHSRSPYLGHEQMFMLYANNQKTSMAIHSPASIDRKQALNNGNAQDNRISYGCVSPNTGVLKRWYNNKLLNRGDSVYIIPEMQSNYIYEDNNGKLSTHFGLNLPAYRSKGVQHKYYYNKSK